jgi:flavin reductase (DIM6/NTAB) family NADH-FMN oxidoreductase RutF
VDKFATTGLTPAFAKAIGTVVIAECPVNIECKVTQVLPLGVHELFLGKVVAVQVDESILNERGKVDLAKARLFAYAGDYYWSLGQLLGTYGFSVKS